MARWHDVYHKNIPAEIEIPEDKSLADLFFESAAKSGLPHEINVSYLRELADTSDFTYTVHLPTDLHLGSSILELRVQAVQEIARLFEKLAPVTPLAYDLHINQEPEISHGVWLDNLHWSLLQLETEIGEESSRIVVENIEYPFRLIRSLILKHNVSFCLDIGHAIKAFY